ncbi:MAG TPA: hypothetical protein VJA66_17975 [Thermoanaerobaculia bacterium]
MDSRAERPTKQDAVEYFQAQRRIKLVLAELERGGPAPDGGDRRFERAMLVVLRHTIAANAFDVHRKRIADLGKTFSLPELFDLLAQELPGWCWWSESGDEPPPWSSRAALQRLVTYGQTQGERGKRFAELTETALRLVEQAAPGRAACAVAEAERLVDSGALTSEAVESVRGSASRSIDLEIFHRASSSSIDQPSLRRFLRFFRALAPVALLQALAIEEKRERRRLILALLEAQGEPARREALDLLDSEVPRTMDETEVFVRRNLIYLLTRVPRSGEDGLDQEVAVLARHSAPHLAPMLVKEAIKALGQLGGKRSEQVLQRQHNLLQEMLASPSATVSKEDLQVYLERTATALERRATGGASRPSKPISSKPEPIAGDSLPSLLQRLSEESISGDVFFDDRRRGATVALKLAAGKLVSARAGPLIGAEAFYQLVETFDGGDCALSSRAGKASATAKEMPPLDLKPLLLEGLLRRESFDVARAIVPDDAIFGPKTSEARPHPDEKDGLVTRDVWEAAIGGQSPRACEASVAADSFRIRRLYLHWLEEDALEPALPGGRPAHRTW